MKKLFVTILGLFLILSLDAQYSIPKKKVPEWVKIIGIQVGSIALDAIGDALCDDGEKGWGHSFQAASTGLLLASPLILDIDKKKWLPYIAGYVSFRIALFDPIYNSTRGLPIDYIGDVSLWDKGLQAFNPPKHAQLWMRGISFTAGVAISIGEFKPKPYGSHAISYFPVEDQKEPIHPGIIPACILFSTFVVNEVFVDNAKDGAIVYTVGCSLSIISFAIGEGKRKRWEKSNY